MKPSYETQSDRVIGRIEGKLDHLIEAQKHLMKKWEELSREFNQLHRTQDNQAHELAHFHRRLSEAEQPAHEFGRWRERAFGALMLLSIAGALVGGGAMALWQKISSFYVLK